MKERFWFILMVLLAALMFSEGSGFIASIVQAGFVMLLVLLAFRSKGEARKDQKERGRDSSGSAREEAAEEKIAEPSGPVMLTPEGNLPAAVEDLLRRSLRYVPPAAVGPIFAAARMRPSGRKTAGGMTGPAPAKPRLQPRQKYLQIALNSTLDEAEEIIRQLPVSRRILIEAGTPLVKIYGTDAVRRIKGWAPPGTYIVADNKCADLAWREAEIMARAGANASTCLGVAPVETIDGFIAACRKFGIDSMIDMMNVDSALAVLKKLKVPPDVVMLHRGVDESEFSKEKQIPYYQIQQIKGNYKTLVSIAGGDTIREVQRSVFNGADIVVVWKNFYQPSAETAALAADFLKEVK